MQPPKRKTPIKTTHQFLIRAKMYGVICLNSLEGMMKELDELIPVDMEKDNFDAFSEELRRYQGRDIVPTSHGDYLDRAVRSLAKEIGLQIPIELGNSSAVKQMVSNIILYSQGDDRRQYLEWLDQPSEMISKSNRLEQLVVHICGVFYKKSPVDAGEDNANFVRRSIIEMIRSKATKDYLRSQLASTHAIIPQTVENVMPVYDRYPDQAVYIPNHMEENERIISAELMTNMRQQPERELEMEGQVPHQARANGNIAL